MIQLASDSGNAAALVFFLFDVLYLDGEDVSARPLIERKARLAALLSDVSAPLHYSDHQRGQGRAFHEKACAMSLEGIVSKRADAPYAPGNCGLCACAAHFPPGNARACARELLRSIG
jgi:bifunctional non-homologous end joining protein LigD